MNENGSPRTGSDESGPLGPAPKRPGVGTVLLWIFFLPIMLPWWLMKQGKHGLGVATIAIFVVAAILAPREETAKGPPGSQGSEVSVEKPENTVAAAQGSTSGADEQATSASASGEDPRKGPRDFVDALKEAGIGPEVVLRVSRDQLIDDKLVITVGDSWHYEPKQMRLQAAQNLWQLWASINSPDDPDRSRIELVDGNGNKVGGSRIWGGSMISVQDD